MKANCQISILRPQCSDGSSYISIRIEDLTSSITFFDGKMELDEFARALTGFSCCNIEAELMGLEFIGKVRVYEKRSIEYPHKSYYLEEMSKWLEENAQEEGWIVNTYLGSQGSIQYVDNKTILNYSVTKYIDP